MTEKIKMAQIGCHQKIILYVENIFSVEDPQLIQGKELLRHEKQACLILRRFASLTTFLRIHQINSPNYEFVKNI